MKIETVYESAKIEILMFEDEDIIRTSNSAFIELPEIDLTEM